MTPYIYPGIDLSNKIGFVGTKKRPNKIAHLIFDYYGITYDDLRSKCRKKNLVRARVMTAFFIKKSHSHISHVNLGAMIGGRDHSTITYYIDTFNDMLIYNDFYQEAINLKIKIGIE